MTKEDMDRLLWADIRAALLLIVAAIERRYALGKKFGKSRIELPQPTDSIGGVVP